MDNGAVERLGGACAMWWRNAEAKQGRVWYRYGVMKAWLPIPCG